MNRANDVRQNRQFGVFSFSKYINQNFFFHVEIGNIVFILYGSAYRYVEKFSLTILLSRPQGEKTFNFYFDMIWVQTSVAHRINLKPIWLWSEHRTLNLGIEPHTEHRWIFRYCSPDTPSQILHIHFWNNVPFLDKFLKGENVHLTFLLCGTTRMHGLLRALLSFFFSFAV